MESFVVDAMRLLHKHGYDVTLCCAMDPEFIRRHSDFAHLLALPITRRMNPIRFVATVAKLFEEFRRGGYDIVQFSTPIAALAASLAAFVARVPVRLYCQWGIRYTGFAGLRRAVFRVIERLTCWCATWIEPDSHGNREFSIKEGLYGPQKSSVIGRGSANGVDLGRFDSSKRPEWSSQVRSELGLVDGAVVLGFVGRVTRDKGMNEILGASRSVLQDSSNVYLLVAGSLEEIGTLDADLVRWAEASQRVMFLGRRTDIHRVMASFDVLLLPSYREGFGSVVIEAGSLGVPAIVSDIPGPTDAVVADETGLVVPKADVMSLRRAMEFMVRNPERRRGMGERAEEHARANFDRDVFLLRILGDRDRLLSAVGGKR